MSLNIHTSINEVPQELSFAYFQKGYFQSQAYEQFICYSNDDFFIPFDITPKIAISIPRSPFGSIIRRNNTSHKIDSFITDICADLKSREVEQLEICHPSAIYQMFASVNDLEGMDFQVAFNDINQHIELSDYWEDSIHNMQKRKLGSLRSEGFEFRKMERDEFETAHKFILVCRQAQGLQINIGWQQLKDLIDRLPDTYHCFGVFREDKISAICITVNVTSEIAYYYLPATSPMFRDKSPMVLLIDGMVKYYRNKGFEYLDLGISSLQGKPQEPLRIFKERMGAVETSKPTLLRPV
ncbi:GNAT family N-acetyltransferase [Ekhidna sp. To15]|uniref:GNAT family N-acetyltransferase n=1 Tax=Ekhidna sp. To15 TaxID=3395267 RepID=UPI003F51D790